MLGVVSHRLAVSQTCQPVAAGAQPASESWVEPYRPSDVARQALLVARQGFDSVTVDSSGYEITAIKRSWPTRGTMREWQSLPYPGVRLHVTIRAAEEWTRVDASVGLLCVIDLRAAWPDGRNPTVFILANSLAEYTNPLSSHFNDARGEIPGHSCAPLNDGDRKIRVCREIARRLPEALDAQLEYALSLIRFYRYNDAKGPVRRVLELGDDRFDVWMKLGDAMYEEERFAGAVPFYEHAAIRWPDSTNAQLALGLALARSGPRRVALPALQRAIRLGSIQPEAFYYEALGLMENRDDARALESFRRAYGEYLRVLPRRRLDARTWACMGLTAAELGMFREAVSYFERARRIRPVEVDGDGELALVYRRSIEQSGPQPPAPLPPAPADSARRDQSVSDYHPSVAHSRGIS